MSFILVITGLIALGLLTLAFRTYRHKRLIDDTPTSKTQGAFIGLTELKGSAESDSPITSYLAGIKCVYYRWQVQEHWSRMVTDSKGRMHQESGWKTVAKGDENISFYLKDDTGVIQVNPEGANITGSEVLSESCKRDNPLYFGKGPLDEVVSSDHRRRFQEWALPLHVQLYVMGQSREREDVVAAEIARDKHSPLFIISTRTEKQISKRFALSFWLWLVLGLFVTGGGITAWSFLNNNSTGFSQAVLISILLYLFAAGLAWLWTVYNSLIGLGQQVKQGWSQIEVELKRRHALIPNLAKAVEGYGIHERGTQTLITELRNQESATPPGVSGADYKGLLPLFRATMEQYPDLKADGLFLSLQNSLTETEQRIALARDYYNQVTTYYNTRLEIFPDRLAAWLAYLKPRLLLLTADFERAPVPVKLAS